MHVYIVRALGFGDNEDAWENVRAFSTQAAAEFFKQQLTAQWEGAQIDIQELAFS